MSEASFSEQRTLTTPKSEMRAVALEHFGGPEVLAVRSIPIPEPKPDQVLIQVKSAGVGIWDIAERQGILAPMFEHLYGIKANFPYVIGSEGAGKIVALGENVGDRFRKGDLVYSDGWAQDPKAGFYAEYTAVDAERAMPIPSNLTVEEAGALYIDGAVALRGLADILGLKRDQKLMIFGASGGIGHLAVQLAKRMGSRVFAAASREDGVALALRLGADASIDGHTGDIAASAREFAPNGFDAALITVRGQNREAIKSAGTALTTMREGGRVAYPWTDNVAPAPITPSNVKAIPYGVVDDRGKIFPGLMDKLNRLIGSGPFEVHLGNTFSFDEVAEAHQALQSHFLGRLALLPGS